MIRVVVTCFAVIFVAASCETTTDNLIGFPGGGGGTVTQSEASGTWSLTLTRTSTLACAGGALADGSVVAVNLTVQSDGTAATTSTWRSPSSGALLPLSGSVQFSSGVTDLILSSGGSTAMELRGTITSAGAFSGTITDPAAGFTPVYGTGCEYNAPGSKG